MYLSSWLNEVLSVCPIKNSVVCFKNTTSAASYLLISSKILPEAFKELLKWCIVCWSGGNKIASTTLLPKKNIMIILRSVTVAVTAKGLQLKVTNINSEWILLLLFEAGNDTASAHEFSLSPGHDQIEKKMVMTILLWLNTISILTSWWKDTGNMSEFSTMVKTVSWHSRYK